MSGSDKEDVQQDWQVDDGYGSFGYSRPALPAPLALHNNEPELPRDASSWSTMLPPSATDVTLYNGYRQEGAIHPNYPPYSPSPLQPEGLAYSPMQPSHAMQSITNGPHPLMPSYPTQDSIAALTKAELGDPIQMTPRVYDPMASPIEPQGPAFASTLWYDDENSNLMHTPHMGMSTPRFGTNYAFQSPMYSTEAPSTPQQHKPYSQTTPYSPWRHSTGPSKTRLKDDSSANLTSEKIDMENVMQPTTKKSKWGKKSQVGKAGKPATPPGPKPVKLGELFRYATPLERLLNLTGLICGAASGAAQPLMTILFGNLTTKFLALNDPTLTQDEWVRQALDTVSSVNHDALYLVIIGICSFVVIYVYMAIFVYTGEVITQRIRKEYLRAILRQEVAYFDKLGAGEITTRIQSDIQLIQDGISDKLPLMVAFISTFITGFVVAYVRNWKLALVMTSILPCIVGAAIVMNMFVSKYQQVELEHVAKAASIAEESLSTIRTIKAFAMNAHISKLYQARNGIALNASKRRAMASGIGIGAFFFCIYCAYALAFYFGSKLVADGEVQSGIVMNVIFSVLIGAFSMAMLAPNLQSLSFAQAAGGKVFETIDRKPAIDSSSPDGLRPEKCYGHLSVRHVDFKYPSRPDVQILKDFNLEMHPGQTTALVGPSGSGKSTIISLVERFYDPNEGQVFLDGIPLPELNIQWLRTQIGLVAQEPVLFATTVWENIAFGLLHTQYEHWSESEKDKLIVHAAKLANAHDFIMQLPQGYQTHVGERASLLSGGQKQRVSIARAVVKNPSILLLDEATSALDTQSEGIVQEALDRAAHGRTTITVAHRLSTIKNADNIVVMKGGIIMEQGKHNDLLDLPEGLYASLVSAQRVHNSNTQTMISAPVSGVGAMGVEPNIVEPVMPSLKHVKSHVSMTSVDSTLTHVMKFQGMKMGAYDEKPLKQKTKSLGFLLMRLSRIGHDLIGPYFLPGVLCAIATGAAYPCFSILFGLALTNYSRCPNLPGGQACPEPERSQMRHTANHHALYFFIIAILSTITTVFQNSLIQQGSAILMQRLRSMMLSAYMRADVAYFDEEDHSSGTLTSSLAENTLKINSFIGVSMGAIVQSIATLIIGAIIALIYGWKLALVVIACVPFTLSAGFVRLKLVVQKDVKVRKVHLGTSQMACESAAAIRTVASLTREEDCLERYTDALQKASMVAKKAALIGNLFYALAQATSFFVIALGFWYGYQLLLRQEYNASQFFTIFTAVVFGSIQAGNVFNFVPDISNAAAAGTNMFALLDNKPSIDIESHDGIVLDHCEGHLQFEGVQFEYPSRPGIPVLRGVDLDVHPGTHVALVGPSGCGKSTTIQLIERFYDVTGGRILLDGHDIRTLNLQSLRKYIALVSQEPTLYDGTIGFNLRLGALEDPSAVTMDQMREAARSANILEFIEGLPDGFETEVGGKGTQLSGGQKQRIAIARALIRNPKILLLDEATSALDSDSEKIVQQALDRASAGRTTISIAHRLATIARAHCIYAFQDGVIAESGDHQTLMNHKGIYANLVALQALEKQV